MLHQIETRDADLQQEIRDRQQAHAELEHQRTLTLRSDRLRSLGEMAAGIAHELNQPLVGVRGMAEHILIALERGWDSVTKSLRIGPSTSSPRQIA